MKTKTYPHVTGLYGDNGENPGALAVHAVLDPSPNYPEAGRIIVGSPATTPTIPGYIPSLGGFNGGPDAIERLAAMLSEAVRDVRAVTGKTVAVDRPDFSPMAELAKWRRWASHLVGDDGFVGDEEQHAAVARQARIHAQERLAVESGWVELDSKPAMKIDLDGIERKARAATAGEWAADRVPGMRRDDEPILANVIALELGEDGRQQQIADCYDNTSCADRQCGANAAYIAAASPPVVLALIAENRRLERIAKAATAFVDEQGKIATRELLERADFATSAWEDLVAAVPEGGR